MSDLVQPGEDPSDPVGCLGGERLRLVDNDREEQTGDGERRQGGNDQDQRGGEAAPQPQVLAPVDDRIEQIGDGSAEDERQKNGGEQPEDCGDRHENASQIAITPRGPDTRDMVSIDDGWRRCLRLNRRVGNGCCGGRGVLHGREPQQPRVTGGFDVQSDGRQSFAHGIDGAAVMEQEVRVPRGQTADRDVSKAAGALDLGQQTAPLAEITELRSYGEDPVGGAPVTNRLDPEIRCRPGRWSWPCAQESLRPIHRRRGATETATGPRSAAPDR